MREYYELNKEEKSRLKELLNSQAFRIKYFQKRLFSFGLYYFGHFFTHNSSDYHRLICKSLAEDKNLLIIAFREFGKSIWIMIYIIHSIVYKTHNFILYFSFEQRLSASRLFDIIVQLKSNQLLIRDYGQLFPDNNKKPDDLQKKSINEFITTNKVKVKSMSIGTTARGLLYTNKEGAYRPSLIIGDDIDVLDSVRNIDTIDKNEDFFKNEVIGGADSQCKMIILGNIIGNDGLIPRYKKEIESEDKWITYFLPIKIDGKIIWDRFVETDKEAEEFCKQGINKISLESKKIEQGNNYKPNFELIPLIKLGDPVFNIEKIQNTKTLEYKEDISFKGLRIYQEKPCIIGVDTALGNKGGDYSTIVGYDKLKRLVLTYQGKKSPTDIYNIIEYLYNKGYIERIIPENNSIGLALINKLKESYLRGLLYNEQAIDKITNKPTMRYGFSTNRKSKMLIIDITKQLIEDGILEEFDERTKQEFYNFYMNDKGGAEALKGSHDDLVMATMLSIYGTTKFNTLNIV